MTKIDTEKTNVIRPRFGEPVLRVDHRNDAPLCAHTHLWIQERRGIVVCRAKNCGAEVDPIDVLVRLSRDWDTVTYRAAEIDRIANEVKALKREKARILSAIRKLEPEKHGLVRGYCWTCGHKSTWDGDRCLGCSEEVAST